MAYINFKEERAVTLKQLNNRKKNNEKLFQYMIKHKNNLIGYMPDNKYSYNKVELNFIGKKGLLDETKYTLIENRDIICAVFKECQFHNVHFKDCNFIGCIFDECNLNSTIFENCIFTKEDSDALPSLNKKDNFSSTFYNSTIYAKFLNSNLPFTIFENCTLNTTSFEQSNLSSIIIINSNLIMISFEDSDMSGTKFMNTYIKNLEFKDRFKSKLDEKTFFDKIPFKENTKDEYEGFYMIYETLADKFKENALNNNFGEYYYLCNKVKVKTLKIFPKISSYAYWITCGYGERPWYALICSIVIIFIFAVLYLLIGIDISGETVKYTLSNLNNFSLHKFLLDFNEALNLSFGIFGGVGFNNAKPIQSSYILSNFEVIIGVCMMGTGIGTLTRKLVR